MRIFRRNESNLWVINGVLEKNSYYGAIGILVRLVKIKYINILSSMGLNRYVEISISCWL